MINWSEASTKRGIIWVASTIQGQGDYIKEWNNTLPKPTDEQIDNLYI